MARTTCVLAPQFHRLAEALADDLLASVGPPITRTGIVVPSSPLLMWLRSRLGRAGHRLGVQLLTLDALAARLAGAPERDPIGSDVHRLLLSQQPPPEVLAPFADTEGLRLAAYRDLHDAGMTPDHLPAIEDALRDDPWWVLGRELLRGYAGWRHAVEAAGLEDRSDRVRRAVRRIELGAPTGFDRIFFYGVYDLTGVMAELVVAVARTVGGRIYFPAFDRSGDGGYLQEVFDSVIRPISDAVIEVEPSSPPAPTHALFDASGEEAEVEEVARRIARWGNEKGGRGRVPWHRVAIIARDLTPYLGCARRVLRRFGIPMVSSQPVAARVHGPIRGLLATCDLARDGIRRDRFIDAIRFGGPLARAPYVGRLGDLDAALRHFGVVGPGDWDALWAHLAAERELAPPSQRGAPGIPGAVLAHLKEQLELAEGVVADWPCPAAIGTHLERWEELTTALFQDGALALAPREALEQTPGLVSREAFLRGVTRALEGHEVAEQEAAHGGVRLLDVMSARAMTFERVYLIGVNRRRWPRTVSEDALIPDRIRRRLRTDLGLEAVPIKERGHAEEALLFEHALAAGTEACTVSWLRSDEEGKAMSPSPFVDALRTGSGTSVQEPGPPHYSVPRRRLDALRPLIAGRDAPALTPRDLAVWLAVELGPAATPHLSRLSGDIERRLLLHAGADAQRHRENLGAPLGDRDGIVGAGYSGRDPLRLNATEAEALLRCPWRYFTERVLGARPVERVGEVPTLDRRRLGNIVHAVHEQLITWLAPLETALLDDADTWEDARELAQRFGLDALRETLIQQPAIAQLGEQLLQPALETRLDGLVDALRARFSDAHGLRPGRAEATLSGAVTLDSGHSMRLRARVDRLDQRADSALEAVDLKTGSRFPETSRRLLTQIQRGERLQAAFYHWLVPNAAWAGYEVVDENGEIRRVGLDRAQWTLAEPTLRRVLQAAGELLVGGRFIMRPGVHCRFCTVTASCSRQHWPSKHRLEATTGGAEDTAQARAIAGYLDMKRSGVAADLPGGTP